MSDNRYTKIAVVFTLVLLFTLAVRAEPARVFEEKGCIWLADGQTGKHQLTTYGKDSTPVLSPNGKSVAFLRKSTKKAFLVIGEETDYSGDHRLADQVWLLDLKKRKERLLATDSTGGKWDGQRMIGFIDDNLCFSPDGDRLYFITSAWVMSGALHVVNLKTGKETFLMAANSIEVVMQGEYRGHLIVSQHRHFLGQGSYDWSWLFSPAGKEIGPLGETQEQIDAFKAIYAKPAG